MSKARRRVGQRGVVAVLATSAASILATLLGAMIYISLVGIDRSISANPV